MWPENGHVYNAVVLIDNGKVEAVRFKVDLPNYGVFDEKRVFTPGPMPGPVNFRGVRLGVPICEDIWGPDVVECLAETGAEILISPNGSPFDWTKPDVRMNIAVARVVESGLPLVYVNQVGGQDELVFDGASFVLNADKSLAVQLPAWEEKLAAHRVAQDATPAGAARRASARPSIRATRPPIRRACSACATTSRRTAFPASSSASPAASTARWLRPSPSTRWGPQRVRAVMMPYRFTSDESVRDADACAKALGVNYQTLPIEDAVLGLTKALEPALAGTQPDTTEENIQARARGIILMALSNKFGGMVVTTGNKSEMSVGYATLYGDMNGGYNPIKDLYKMEVYRLARWRNAHVPKGGKGPAGEVIPESIITKVPTAELRPNQTDQDSLPPYEALDDILRVLVEKEMPLADIVARGHAAETVKKIERLLYLAEYKRRQAPPGVKISSRNFGRDRRYPIVNKFREPL